MYALKVKLGSSIKIEDEISEEASRLADALLKEQQRTCDRDEDDAAVLPEGDSLDFSAGNPRVEHITGVIHLFRMVPLGKQEGEAATGPAGPLKLPEGRSERLCVLAIPADMGIADFCRFVGGYLPAVRHMRVVRRDRRQRSIYSVLMRFGDLASAEAFHSDYNGRPFSTLEPEVICRLVWVRDVDFLPPIAGCGCSSRGPGDVGCCTGDSTRCHQCCCGWWWWWGRCSCVWRSSSGSGSGRRRPDGGAPLLPRVSGASGRAR